MHHAWTGFHSQRNIVTVVMQATILIEATGVCQNFNDASFIKVKLLCSV